MQLNKTPIGAITDEDLAIDREIERLAAANQMDQDVALADAGAPPELRPSVEKPHLLSEYVDNYRPAMSHATLEEQVFLAKAHGADSIEAEDIVFKSKLGKVPPEPYIMYHGVKVYRVGMIEIGRKNDSLTIEQKMFGSPK